MPDISEFLGTQIQKATQPKKKQEKERIDISEFLGKPEVKEEAPQKKGVHLGKPLIFEEYPKAVKAIGGEIGKGITGLFKPPEAKAIDVTKRYHPEPATTYQPGVEKPRPITLKRGKGIAETGELTQQLKAEKPKAEYPVDEFIDRYREFVGGITEGTKGAKWLAAKGSQFLYSLPLFFWDVPSIPGQIIAGKKSPQKAYEEMYSAFPQPVNNFLEGASELVSPIRTGTVEEQKESLRQAYNEWKQSPEAPFFSVLMGSAGLRAMVSVYGQAKGYWKVMPAKSAKILEEVIKEESPKIPEKPLSKPKPEPIAEKPVAPIEKSMVGGEGGLQPIKGTGETKVRGLAKHIEEKAIESGLTKGYEELPTYDVLEMKTQAGIVADVVNKDYARGKRIAMGQEAPPAGTTPEGFLVGIEEIAKKTGDATTSRDLALVSKLPGEATTMGQRLRTLAERDPESLVGAIRDIAQTRVKAVTKRVKNIKQVKGRLVEGIKAEMKKTAPKRQSWEQFIESIRCK